MKWCFGVCIWIICLLVSMPVLASPKVVYLAHLNPNSKVGNPTGAMALTFMETLEALEPDGFRVEIFPKGELGNEQSIVDLVRRGVIQSAIVSVGGLAKIYPRIDILNDPFRFHTMGEVYKTFDGPFGDALAKDIKDETQLNVLGYGDTGGLFVITNAKRRVAHPRDLKGLKIRTMSVQSHQVFLKALGAIPVPIAWAELYGALRNGLVDGQMNPANIVRFAKFEKVQTYLTVTNHMYTPYIWLANAAFMAELSSNQSASFMTAVRQSVLASRKFVNVDKKSLLELGQTMHLKRLSRQSMAEFQEITRGPMTDFFRKTYGAKGLALLEAYRAP